MCNPAAPGGTAVAVDPTLSAVQPLPSQPLAAADGNGYADVRNQSVQQCMAPLEPLLQSPMPALLSMERPSPEKAQSIAAAQVEQPQSFTAAGAEHFAGTSDDAQAQRPPPQCSSPSDSGDFPEISEINAQVARTKRALVPQLQV